MIYYFRLYKTNGKEKSIFTLLFLLAILTTYLLKAQTLQFQCFTTANGLSQNSIYSIAQTKEGFMWFGTQDGLNRFDGKNFWLADLKDNYGKRRYSKMITALLTDSNDLLWVGTTQDLLIYNRQINRFFNPDKYYVHFRLPPGCFITNLLQDAEKNIWILTQRNGLFAYSTTKNKMLDVAWQRTIQGPVSCISIDEKKNFWFCSNQKIYAWDSNKGILPIANESLLNNISSFCVVKNDIWLVQNGKEVCILKQKEFYKKYLFTSIYQGNGMVLDPNLLHQSNDSTLWIGSRSGGVIKVNLKEHTYSKSQGESNNPTSLVSPFSLSFFTNSQGTTWIGLSGGVAMNKTNKMDITLWREPGSKDKPAPDNRIFSIFSSNDEDFYMGTLYGGLHYLNVTTHKSIYFSPTGIKNNNEASKNIYNIVQDKNGLLWMATWAGLFSFDISTHKFTRYYNPSDNKTVQLTSVLLLANTNKIIVSGYNDGLRIFNITSKHWEHCADPDSVLTKTIFRVRYMKEIEKENILMSTEGKALVQYNYRTGQFTFFPQIEAISSASRYFLEDGKLIWIATDDGLVQANRETKKIEKVWTTANGLPNNYFYGILKDNYGLIWVSSNQGLSTINTQTGKIENFRISDGLQEMEFNTASCFKGKKGQLWFGGVNGVNCITSKGSGNTRVPLPPIITNIKVMNEKYDSKILPTYIHNIRLPYSKNFISIEFQSPDFCNGDISYEYILEGVNKSWVSNVNSGIANYTQLSPGRYIFKSRSLNNQNVYSESSQSIIITIVPPWYKTIWFYMLISLLFIAFGYTYITSKLKSIQYKASINQKVAETEMAALKAQMNPHFMFNCINSIDAFIHTNDKYNATLYLNKFAKLLRNILDSSKQNIVAFTKDVETLKLYIELEELRHENKFKTIIHIDDDLLNNDYKVPPLIIQPFVENAILHGLKNREDNNGLLQIEIIKINDKIQYLIRDNGIGRKAASAITQNKQSSYGMQISNDRIKLFNKEETPSLKITDLYQGEMATGTEVKVLLNIV